jgi:hypothetical protein
MFWAGTGFDATLFQHATRMWAGNKGAETVFGNLVQQEYC